MLKTIVTCDHCGKELENYIGRLWRTSFLTIGANIEDVHGCTREHLGLALAKLFGLPLDSTTLRLVAEKNAALDAARDAIIKHDAARTRIADLEKQLATLTAPVDVDGKTPGQVGREARAAEENVRGMSVELDWPHTSEARRTVEEVGAQAVLRAFGPQIAAKALQSFRDSLALEDDPSGYFRGKIDASIAALALPTEHPNGFLCRQCGEDLCDCATSFTDPKKPTKPTISVVVTGDVGAESLEKLQAYIRAEIPRGTS